MVELEQLNEFRFYKLEPKFPSRCENTLPNIYCKVGNYAKERACNGLLNLHMTDGSVNMRCPHVDCNKQYEIPRICNSCGRVTDFDDVTCDNCEPIVINIATWKVSIAEGHKALKKINRAFKQDLIKEEEWRGAIAMQNEEIARCEKELEKLDWR